MKLRTKTRSLRVLSAILAMSLAIGTTGGMPIAAENEDVQAEAFAGRELWAPETEEEAAPPNTEGDLSLAQLQTAQLSPEEIPEAVSKEDIAERGHVYRLWKQEEDANSIVFQNRDGTKTLYYFTEAVKYVDENGAVQDKSNTLQDIGSASSASGYRYVNGYNDIKTYFPAQLGSETGLLLKHGDIQIELTPAYAQRGETAEAGAAASIPASDPSPVLPSPTAMESEETAPTGPSGTMPGTTESGTAAADDTAAFPETTLPAEPTLPPVPEAAVDNAPILAKHSVPAEKKTADPDGHTADTVEYAEVFGEHTALRYSPTFSGFKEDIVLSENIGRNEFTFELQTGGLSLAQEGETVGLFDPLTGERVAMLDNILVFDSGGPAADEGEEIVPRHHYYRVETVEPDALYRVTVVVDEAFLNDPGTVYPVVIDPAITLTGSSGGIEDATIYSNYLVNEGSSGSVFVGSYNARYGGTRGVARTLVKIPASALSGIQASQITSAKLYYRDLMCEGDAVRIDCYPLTANWTESTVKCNAAIWTATGSLLSYQTVKSGNGEDGVGGPSGGHWYGFDITTAAKTWINTGNYYGVMLCANAESGAAKTFASANRSSYQPQLVVDYNADHVAVSQVCLSATSLAMPVGSTANLTATIVPSNATKKGITWETTDESIVGVGETGLLCAKKVGTVTITARAEDNTTIKASCLVTVLEGFSYTSTAYSAELAKKCAEYSLLAYDEIQKNSSGLYFDAGVNKEDRTPHTLVSKLQAENFIDISIINYGDDEEANVSYVLARKQVAFQGARRTLVAVIIRGTDENEWQNNMDITGSSYNASQKDHTGFKQAEIDLRENPENGLNAYLSKNSITNPLYLITGHSRGAAVANLLAETLSASAGTSNVFAYTFATPNTTQNPNTSRKNIFNFCFNDDFVPQVPLSAWGYGKHGITYTVTAGDLYESSAAFQSNVDRYLHDSKGKEKANFNLTGTNSLLDYVSENWATVEQFYTKVNRDAMLQNYTLYLYFRDVVATAAMGTSIAILKDCGNVDISIYTPIAQFFVQGSGILLWQDYIYDTHHAFTYYTAMTYGLFV